MPRGTKKGSPGRARWLAAVLSCGLASPASLAAAPRPAAAKSKVAAHAKVLARPKKGHAATKPPPRSQTLPRVPSGDAAHERRVAALREQLESILHDPVVAHQRVGVVAAQLSDGDILFSRNADQRFNPASNTKMLTTAAAIARLGGDFRYLTALYGAPPDVEGVVEGDVVLRGSSDPSFGTGDLVELARSLADRGVTRVHGDIVVDRRPIGYEGTNATDGLILNRNSVSVKVRATEPKHAGVVTVEPALPGVTVENHTTTVKGKRVRLVLDTHRKDDHLVIEVRGRIGEQHGTVTLRRKVADGALLSGHMLASMLPDFGISLDGAVRVGQAKADASTDAALVVHHSIPLADVSRLSNKPSNNFIADAIYKTLGGELFGLPGTLAKGTRAVSDWLVDHGIARERFHLENGSGLTHANRVTPGDLVNLLRAIYYEPDVAPDFVPSLSVGGIDGTLRGRFGGTRAVGLVRAKTGTLTGVSTLSGYVGDKGDVIVFSIMIEGFRWKRTPLVRHVQVQLVDAMLRFLRAEVPGPEPVRPQPEALHQDGLVAPPAATPMPADEDDDKSEDEATLPTP
ncbi:MAG: D-alanyl-D-alanine carboxypeptidase/D-alanyl-D-alanine-endopeptidase [Polyangia bacterium]